MHPRSSKCGFDPALARLCVLASSRAYRAATWSDPLTDTQYLIIETPDRIIVAFRGTSSLEDFLTDADFRTIKINLNNAERVHAGFWRAFNAVERHLQTQLDEIMSRRPGVKVVFTGHSMGGALALIGAFYLSYFYDVEAVYTFGAPDVGNAAFAKRYERTSIFEHSAKLGQRTFCLGNACDPVTWLPPYRFGYRRVGKFFFLPGVAWLKPGFKLPLAARFLAGAYQIFENWRHGRLALLTNHSCDLYKNRVENLSACDLA